jgi:hypothetical protein
MSRRGRGRAQLKKDAKKRKKGLDDEVALDYLII